MTSLNPACALAVALALLLAPGAWEPCTLDGEVPPPAGEDPAPGDSGDEPPVLPPGTDEPPAGDPVPAPPTPPTGDQQDTDCEWSEAIRLPVDLNNDSKSCGGPTGNCYAVSSALAVGAYIVASADAYDATLTSSAHTSSSSSSPGVLHIWRSDNAPCGSGFRARARVGFRARAMIEPAAASGAGGTQAISSGGGQLDASTDGAVEISSASGSVVATVKVGGVTITLAASGGQERSRDFLTQDEAEWAGRAETFLLTGTVFAHASANGTLGDPSASSTAAAERPKATLFVEATCAPPCTASHVYSNE